MASSLLISSFASPSTISSSPPSISPLSFSPSLKLSLFPQPPSHLRTSQRRLPSLIIRSSVHGSIGVHPTLHNDPDLVSPPTFDDVTHLSEYLPDLPTFPSPLTFNPAYATGSDYFVGPDDVVARNVVTSLKSPGFGSFFRRAGPRADVIFEPEEVKACIVTCGGLCPGLNTVIREIVCGLWHQYGVRDIIGIEGGYRGFYARNTIPLNPKVVNDIHKRGGTVLSSSRGGHDTVRIVDSIQDRGINQVYIIGGDGTQKGAKAIYEEVRRRGLKVSVVGIPKTIDNDIAVIDRSFGFDTAVEEAQRAINAAHTEAESVHNGIGLVKLMGRYSGYIAMHATLASRDVDLCLIPEVPFYLEGEGGLFEFVEKRLAENGHMVIVVAEGAGQELMGLSSSTCDVSGNKTLHDVGLWLSQKLKDHFSAATFKDALNLKYIDPTYMIRAIPSNASDNVYCTLLAQSGIHGAMAGYTGFTVGPVNGRHCYIPIARVIEKQNHVHITDRMWARVLSSTNQPTFTDAANKNHHNVSTAATKVNNSVTDAHNKKKNGNGKQETAASTVNNGVNTVNNGVNDTANNKKNVNGKQSAAAPKVNSGVSNTDNNKKNHNKESIAAPKVNDDGVADIHSLSAQLNRNRRSTKGNVASVCERVNEEQFQVSNWRSTKVNVASLCESK